MPTPDSMLRLLVHHIRTHGPVPTAAVREARTYTFRNLATQVPWDAARGELRLDTKGRLVHAWVDETLSGLPSTSLSLACAQRDMLCRREGRIAIGKDGVFSPWPKLRHTLCRLGYDAAVLKHDDRKKRKPLPPLTGAQQHLVRRYVRAESQYLPPNPVAYETCADRRIDLAIQEADMDHHPRGGLFHDALVAWGPTSAITRHRYDQIQPAARRILRQHDYGRGRFLVARGQLEAKGPWLYVKGRRWTDYEPYGDSRDAEAYASLSSQPHREAILQAIYRRGKLTAEAQIVFGLILAREEGRAMEAEEYENVPF